MGANGCAHEMDGSRNTPRMLNMHMHVITPADEAGNIRMHQNNWEHPNSPPDGARWAPDRQNGFYSHADASSGHTDVPGIQTDALTPRNKSQIVRIPRKKAKPHDLPSRSAKQCSDEPNACGNLTDRSSAHMGSHSVKTNAKTPANKAECVRMHQIDLKSRNSPHMPENGTPESTYQWRKVSIDNIGAYVPRSMPAEALGQTFAFGEAQSGVEAIVPSIDGRDVKERAGSRNRGNGDVDDMESGSNIDSQQVEGAQLSRESQRPHPH